jgi:DNA-binding transcriptional MocR family regulator
MEREQATGLGPSTLPVAGCQEDPRVGLHIQSVLARRIRDGEYPAGAELPTETELADEFGCGPGAAAQALRALHGKGWPGESSDEGISRPGPMIILASHAARSARWHGAGGRG